MITVNSGGLQATWREIDTVYFMMQRNFKRIQFCRNIILNMYQNISGRLIVINSENLEEEQKNQRSL